jgi:hypothetical protein
VDETARVVRWQQFRELLTVPCVIAAIIGGVFGVLSTLCAIYCGPPPSPEGEMLSPEAREQLGPRFTAHGRLDHIPENRHVWVAVQRGELLFPKEPEIPRGDQAWVHEFVEGEAAEVVGADVAADESLFSLVLLLVDADRQAEIEAWFAEAEHSGYPGFEVGAEGFTRLDVVEGLSLLPAEGVIEGGVADADSGQPVGGATVTVNDVEVVTEGDGRYQLEGLDPGCYLVTAASDGFEPAVQVVAAIAGRTASADFALTLLPPGAIVGEVTDADDGQPVGGATVTVNDVEVFTDGDGRYQLEALDPGSYTVTVTADGFNDARDTVAVAAGETTTHNLALTPLSFPSSFPLQANEAASPGSVMFRTEASDGTTVLLQDGQTATWVFELPAADEYWLVVRYSNDNFGLLETVTVSIDGDLVGEFQAEDTGDDGSGWNVFVDSPPLGPHELEPGQHELTLSVTGGDGYGVEIDHVSLE